MTSEGPGALFGAHQTFKASSAPLTAATFQSASYFRSPGDSPPGNPFSSIGGVQQPQQQPPPPNFQFPSTTLAGPPTGMNSHWSTQSAAGPVSQNPLGRYPGVVSSSSDSGTSVTTAAYARSQEQSQWSAAQNYHANLNFALPLGPAAAGTSEEVATSRSQGGVPPSQQEGVPPLSVFSQNHPSTYGQFGTVQDFSVSTAGGLRLGPGDVPGSPSQTHANNAPPSSYLFSQGESAESQPSVSMASNLFSAVEGSDFLASSSGQPQPLLTHQDQSAQMVALHASAGSSSSAPSTTLLYTAQWGEQGSVSQYSNVGAPPNASHLVHRQSLPALHARSPPLQGDYIRQPLPPPPPPAAATVPELDFHRPSQLQRTATGQATTTNLVTNELLEKLSSPDEQRSSGGEGLSTGSTPQQTALFEPRPGSSSNSYPEDRPPLAPPTNANASANPERPLSSGDHYPVITSSTSSPLPELTRPLSNAAVSDQQMDRLFLERHESFVASAHATNATNADSQPSSLGSGPRTNADFLPPVSEAITPKRTGESNVASGVPDSAAWGQSATPIEGMNTSGAQQPMFQVGVELTRPLEQITPTQTPTGGYSSSEHPTPIEQQALLNESPLEGELPPSLSSSLNQSVSSLLESQEEFNRMSSPCKILPPAPEGQLSPSPSASQFQVIAAAHHPVPPLQRDSNVVNAHQAFSQLRAADDEPTSSGVTVGDAQEGGMGNRHQPPGMTLLPTLQQGQLETPSSFAAVVAPVPDAQPSYPPFGSHPNLPAKQSPRGVESATAVPVPPATPHSSELGNGLQEKPADVPPSTQAAVRQPSFWPIHAPPSHAANPNPPPSHVTNPNPPPSHAANLNPPPSHAANLNPPPSYVTNPNPPPSHAANPNPPPSHAANPNPPPSHAANPNPPPSHVTNPNPPPSHATNPNPPPFNAANPNPPPFNAANPNPPPSHVTNPNPPPSHAANLNPPPSHVTNPNPPPSHAANPNPPPFNAANPNPPPSHPNPPPFNAANPNPPPSHTANPPPPSHQTFTHTALLPSQPSIPTTIPNAQQLPVNRLPPSSYTQLSSTPETAIASTSVPPVAATSQTVPPVALAVSQTQTASFYDPTTQSSLTDAVQPPGPGLITQPPPQPSATAVPTVHQLVSNPSPPIGRVPQGPTTAPQAPSLTNPPPPAAAHHPPAQQLPQPGVQQPQPTLQTANPQAQLLAAKSAAPGIFPTYSTNAAEVIQAPLAASRLPMQPLPQRLATNAELQLPAVVPTPYAQGGPTNLLQSPHTVQPIAQSYPPQPPLLGTQSAHMAPISIQTVLAPSAGQFQPQPQLVQQQSSDPSTTASPQAGQGLPPSDAPLLSPATLQPQEGGVPNSSGGVPVSSAHPNPTTVAPVQPQLQSQSQLQSVQQQQPPPTAVHQGLPQDTTANMSVAPPSQQQQLQQYPPLVPASHGAAPGHDAYVTDTSGARDRGTDDRGRYEDRHLRYPDRYDQESYDPYYAQERSRHPSYYEQGHDPYGRDFRHGPPPGHPAAHDYRADYRDYRQGYPHERLEHQTRYDYGRHPYWGSRLDPYYDRYYDSYGSRDPYDEYSVDPHHDSRYHYPQDPRRQPGGYYDYEYPERDRHYDSHGQDLPEQYTADSQYVATADQYEYDEYHRERQQTHQLPPTAADSTFSPEASAIYGRQEHFEISEFVDSPSARLPGRHPQQMQHEHTAYHDPAVYYDREYAEGAYEQYDGGYVDEAPWAPIPQPTTPPPPSRQTPELFAHPHVRACFGFGGQLVTVLPNNPNARQPAMVEICCLKNLVEDSSTRAFIAAVEASPGPLIPGDTPKGDVIRFTTREAEESRQKQQTEEDRQAAKNHEDEALLWDLLGLLCQQNGVALPVDISELLMKDRAASDPMMAPTSSRDGGGREEAMDALRKLLLAGRKKDALVLACDRALWGHGLMLASGMDEQSRIYVVNRFASSMMTMDPLNTFYTLLLRRTPSAVKPEGLHRAGDWRAHLAMMLANRTSKLENNCIVTLGDSLLSHGRLPAAHICYHFGYVPFGGYGTPEAKYSLLGVDHSHLKVGTYPEPAELWKMEVYEYAMSLSKQEFFLPTFQMYKFLHALKLAEVGFVERALKYCEQISYSVAKGPQSYPSSFLLPLLDLSVKLYHAASPIGVVETELPSWLIQLQHSVTDALSTDYTPSAVSSPSPAFSSVSQTYAASQQPQQPIIGLGQYLSVPGGGTRGSSSAEASSAASSKEDSVTDLQLAIPKPAQRGEMAANQGGQTLVDAASANAEVGPTEQPQFVAVVQQQQQGGAVDSPSNAGVQPAAFSRGESAGAASFGFEQQPLYSAPSGVFYPTGSPYDAATVAQGGYAQGPYQPQQQEQQGYGQYDQQQPAGVAVSTDGDTNVQFGYGGRAADYGTMAGVDAAQYPSQYGGQQAAVTGSEINLTGETQPVEGGYVGHEVTFPQGSSTELQPQTDTSAVFYWQQQQQQSQLQQGPYGEQQPSPDQVGAAEPQAGGGGAESAKSGDDHVTKNEQRVDDEDETSGRTDTKKEAKKKQPQPQSSGRGWGFNILKYVLPRRKNEVHLPDDGDKKIVWDDEKKKWKNLDADEEEEAGPAAPPTDVELRKTVPGPQQQQATDSTDSAPLMTGAPPSIGTTANIYSRQARKGLRSKYVDVLNPGGTAGHSSAAPPPPAVPLMVPATMAQPRFFVPQQPGNSSPGADYGTTTGADTAQGASQELASGTNQGDGMATNLGKQAGQPDQSIQSNQFGQPSQFAHEQFPAGGVSSSHEVNQQQLQPSKSGPLSFSTTGGRSEPQSFQQPPLQQENTQQQGSSSATNPPPQQPQFFNPSAFGPVTSFSRAHGPPGADSQDDALSTISMASELSQEVSRYMSKQPQMRVPTASAGYQRLRQGIRGTRATYPSLQQRTSAGQQQTAGRNVVGPQGPPPSRDFQQRPGWQ